MFVTLHAFLTGIALIAAIGAQNTFIIKEGLRGGFVYTAALISASCDAILIVVGIIVVSKISEVFVWFKDAMLWAALDLLCLHPNRERVASAVAGLVRKRHRPARQPFERSI